MNHITRQPRSTNSIAASATRPTSIHARGSRAGDLPGTADDQGIRLTWRRLDRMASARTLAMVLASPRSALLMLDLLGPRIPPSTPLPTDGASMAARRRGMGR